MAPQERKDEVKQNVEEGRVSKNEASLVTNARSKPSDEYVLNFAFYSFIGFVAVQTVFAILANSQSMLADSEAMSVDALTYLFNACAERIKKRPFSEAELELPLRVRNYRRELRRLYLELVPPTISVSALLIITFYTLKEAYSTLEGDEEGNDEEDVSIGIMLFFSTANLLLDVVNVTCFARAGSAFGLEVIKRENTAIRRTMSGEAAENMSLLGNGDTNVDKNDGENYGTTTSISRPEGPPELVNLNMCSAWTHVCADTLRSTTVLVVSFIATIFPTIDASEADAVAAVIVSFVIIGSLFPLLQGLVLTAVQIASQHRHPVTA
jgi:Co/Zn/Cd efflux system component